ncbi:sulfite exporter TauE/SafE family protein [Streptomyces sp. NPDC007084]|uniref:urease accessory protein UreH domain-containing protein n=1 Tax=Streptomyces sp. NPDC007084 TaxID=3154313 RepID=UPI0034567562
MRARRAVAAWGAVLAAGLALALVPAGQASAHPLGNFTVNRYDGLVVAPGALRVEHVEDLAEIPATQAKPGIARLGMPEWARQRCEAAARGSGVTVGGHEVTLTPGASRAVRRPGQAGLDTLRVECRLTAPLPEDEDDGEGEGEGEGATLTVRFHGAGADRGPGWREITARGDRMTLASSDVPRSSVSAELTTYPKALLSSPADTGSATLRVSPGGPALVEGHGNAPAAGVLPRGADRWTEALNNLVARHHLTVGFAALALVIAVGLGALHALAPGHGKTLMAATAAARGGRARLKDVLPLAASVTVTHTLGVVALGLLVTAGSAAAPSVIAWLGVSSGVLVTLAGLTLLRRAWHHRSPEHAHATTPASEPRHTHTTDPAHGHDHGHSHSHSHGHGHGHGHEAAHPGTAATEAGPGADPGAYPHTLDAPAEHPRHRPLVPAHATTTATTATTATATVLARPRTSVTTSPQTHPHTHAHTHPHPHAPHPHPSPALEHTHGGFTHTHEIAPTLRGTVLLGFAGGLVPSPSAVVVLVGAAALGQAWFGLLLVLAYGVGLALTLTAAGFAVVRLGDGMNRVLARRPRWAGGRVVRLVRRAAPLGSAAIVVALGAGLVLKGAASVLA